MEFSAEEFADIIDSLKCQLPVPKGAEQRRAQRMNRQVRMSITPIKNGKRDTSVSVLVRDVSARGIGFLFQRQMAASAQFVLRLPRSEQMPLSILCTVMHCERAGNQLFAIGAEFTCVTDEVERIDSDAQDRIRHSILD